MNLYIAILFCFGLVAGVSGQGRLVDPPGRGSLWRAGYDTPINNNDNVLNCGGIQVGPLQPFIAESGFVFSNFSLKRSYSPDFSILEAFESNITSDWLNRMV